MTEVRLEGKEFISLGRFILSSPLIYLATPADVQGIMVAGMG
jgi:hypothetical protein